MIRTTLPLQGILETKPVLAIHDFNGGRLPDIFKGIRLRPAFITPELARELLGEHLNYRKLKKHKARKYAKVMERGDWSVYPPISIGRDGCLHDGQHRLWAIIISGKGQWFMVVTGVPGNAVNHYDNGSPRKPADVLRHDAGKELKTSANRTQAIIRLVHFGANKHDAILNCDYPRLYEHYRTVINRFSSIFSKPSRHCPAALVAAFCRAWLTLADDRLMKDILLSAAIKYLNQDFSDERMTPLRLYAERLCRQRRPANGSNTAAYLRAANAIQAFLNRREMKRLVPAQIDPFPLPCSDFLPAA